MPSTTDGARASSRERVALVIFIVLMLVGGAILVSYFSTGKDWSVAATFLDDSVGSLDDYSVVVFEGTVEPERDSDEGIYPRDARSTMQVPYGSIGVDATEQTPTEGISQIIKSIYQRFEKLTELPRSDTVYVSDVRDLYELKGASVVTLKVDDLVYYAEPLLLDSGNRTFGVFSIASYTSRVQMRSIVDALEASGADSIVCIAPRSAMMSGYDGLDVVIFTDESPEGFEALSAKRGSDETLLVRSPERGTAGVVIFSSNNVPSFKSVEAL